MRRLGFEPMPWQVEVAMVGGEIDPDTGLPAYREVVVTTPRQSAKTTLALGWELQRAIGWGSAQRIAYSAQSGSDARKKMLDDQAPLLKPHHKALGIANVLRSNDNTAIVFDNGSRITTLGSTDDAGHGKTIDLAVKDELFADYDNRRDQALIPAMVTRAAAQMLTLSTMGTDASVPLNQVIERGRANVTADRRDAIAYFEWSAEPGADPDDPEVWHGCMPALGITITEPVVRHARENMSEDEFRRAFLNQSTGADQRIIPIGAWDSVCDPAHTPTGDAVFGLDMSEDRASTSIVAAAGGVLELIETRLGPAEAVARIAKLARRAPVFVCDRSPAASLTNDIRANAVTVIELSVQDQTEACGGFYDAVTNRDIAIRRHPALDAAAASANKRSVGDAWIWARKGAAADVSPLIAATLARWGTRQKKPAARGPLIW